MRPATPNHTSNYNDQSDNPSGAIISVLPSPNRYGTEQRSSFIDCVLALRFKFLHWVFIDHWHHLNRLFPIHRFLSESHRLGGAQDSAVLRSSLFGEPLLDLRGLHCWLAVNAGCLYVYENKERRNCYYGLQANRDEINELLNSWGTVGIINTWSGGFDEV